MAIRGLSDRKMRSLTNEEIDQMGILDFELYFFPEENSHLVTSVFGREVQAGYEDPKCLPVRIPKLF